MWNPGWAGAPFDGVAESFLEVPAVGEVGGELAGERREAARARWIANTRDEYRSMVAFTHLLADLTEERAPVDVLACAARIVRDEARHVALCSQVVERLGGFGDDAREPAWVKRDRSRPARDRAAYAIVGSLCIGETLSVASLAAARDEETHLVFRAVIDALLADESFHSRFGFWWVERHWRGLPFSTRRYVESWLPAVFAEVDARHSGQRGAMVRDTVERKILPPLAAAGVRADQAWEARHA